MTLDEFRSKYRLQQRLTQRGVASYHAVDSSGRVVMVHSLDSASREEVDRVRGMVHELSAVDRTKILEILDVDGAPVIVTEYLQGFQTLAQWLELRTRSAPTQPVMPVVQSKGPPRGEFTQLFGPAETPNTPVLERPPVTNSPPAPDLGPAPAPPAPPRAAAKAPAAGEFTQLFGAIRTDAAAPPGSASESTKPPQPEVASETAPPPGPMPKPAGDFTQLFGPGAGTPGTTPPPPPAPNPGPPTPAPPTPSTGAEPPSIVVRWRDDASAPEPPPPSEAKPQIRWKASGPENAGRPEPPPPQKGPGEFTRLFGPQDGLQALPDVPGGNVEPLLPERPAPEPPARPPAHPPRAGAKDPGGFTQLLRAAADLPDVPGAPTNPPDVEGPPAGPGPSAKGAPGEFTRLMAGLPPGPAAPPGGPRPAAQPAGGPGPSEFTRMMAAVPSSPTPAAGGGRPHTPPPEPEAEEGQGGPSLVKLFVALGVVLVLAAALILFFAIKK